MSKGTISVNQILKLVLGIGCLFILITLAGRLLDNRYESDRTEKKSDSYFEALVKEFEVADADGVGEFIMWQNVEDIGKQDVFLIYFGDRFQFKIPVTDNYDITFITYGRENIICVCFFDGEEAVCKNENCMDLDYPVNAPWIEDENYHAMVPWADDPDYVEGQWIIGNSDKITIERDREEYLVKRIWDDGSYTGPTRLMDVRPGDIIVDGDGEDFEVEISEGDLRTGGWMIQMESLEYGDKYWVSGKGSDVLNDWEEFGYEIKEGGE